MSGGNVPQHFMWFEASASLRQNAETFIQNIHKGERAPQNGLLQRVLDEFVVQTLETYFTIPTDRIGLGPIARKMVVTAVATLRKTIQMVVGRVIRKLHNKDMRSLAEFMDQVMLRDYASRQGTNYVAFPLETSTVQQFQDMQQRAHSEDPLLSAHLIAAFQTVADEAVTYLFAEPVQGLRLGSVLDKIAQMGIESTRSVITGMIRRIFSNMTPQQSRDAVDYFCFHISTAEQLGIAAKGRREWA